MHSYPNPIKVFVDIDELILKFIQKSLRLSLTETILKKIEVRGIKSG